MSAAAGDDALIPIQKSCPQCSWRPAVRLAARTVRALIGACDDPSAVVLTCKCSRQRRYPCGMIFPVTIHDLQRSAEAIGLESFRRE